MKLLSVSELSKKLCVSRDTIRRHAMKLGLWNKRFPKFIGGKWHTGYRIKDAKLIVHALRKL